MTIPDRFVQLEHLLGRLLVVGVALSAVCLAGGLATSVLGWSGAAAALQVGLWVLIATPVLRVAVSFVEYVRQRDWFFAAATLAVLGVLTVTFLFAWRVGRG